MESTADTIAALATATGEAALAVIRVSGPRALEVTRAFLVRPGQVLAPQFRPRVAHLCEVLDQDGRPADQAVVTWYPGPHSYTGEDVVELSVHGGMLAPRVTLEQCLRHGARMAGPGEFTLRAFLAGRMDLSQAEAVIDTIQAHSRAALKLAHRQLSGSTRTRVAQARDAVVGLLATIEASVDFPEDVDEPDRSLMALSIEDVISMLVKILADSKAGQIYRDGIRLAIVGRPNVGKSSILNAILRSERSIVTDIPGTTRDVIEESLSIGGVPVRAADTAGLRVTADPVEKIGVERALATLTAADLCILVLDRSVPLHAEDWMVIDHLRGCRMVVALNKCDLPPAWPCAVQDNAVTLDDRALSTEDWAYPPPVVETAAPDGAGIDSLEQAILQVVFEGKIISDDALDGGGTRRVAALERAIVSLRHAREAALSCDPVDLLSVDLRGALDSMGEITGETAPYELLHAIFSRFCIGK